MFESIAWEWFCPLCGYRASICRGHAAAAGAEAMGQQMCHEWAEKVRTYRPPPIVRPEVRLPPHLRRMAEGWGDEETVAALKEEA